MTLKLRQNQQSTNFSDYFTCMLCLNIHIISQAEHIENNPTQSYEHIFEFSDTPLWLHCCNTLLSDDSFRSE